MNNFQPDPYQRSNHRFDPKRVNTPRLSVKELYTATLHNPKPRDMIDYYILETDEVGQATVLKPLLSDLLPVKSVYQSLLGITCYDVYLYRRVEWCRIVAATFQALRREDEQS